MIKLERLEAVLLAALLGLLALAIVGPNVPQPAYQHDFSDQRVWFGIPFAMDVLSNVAFLAWGLAGVICLTALSRRARLNAEHLLAGLFFSGLVLTAGASAWYHIEPNDPGLGIDRLGMAIAFAGLLGMAVAGRISHRAGVATAAALLLVGPLSVWFWLISGNVLPWGVVQFGGMVLALWMAWIKPKEGSLNVPWAVVIAVYFVAKVLEAADHQIYELTSGLVSGHTLKHLVASLAAWPVFTALRAAALASAITRPSRS